MSNKDTIYELTGIRGLAALGILIGHLAILFPNLRASSLAPALNLCGILGMGLFFTLSGVVIYYNYFEKIISNPVRQSTVFVVARFARLYPLYFIFVMSYFLFYLFTSHDDDMITSNIATLPMFLTGTQTWVYGFIGKMEILYRQGNANITWSISTELFFYLAFIFITLYIMKFTKKIPLTLMIIILLIRFGYVYLTCVNGNFINMINTLYASHQDDPLGNVSANWVYFIYHAPYFRIFEFLFGCAVAQYILNAKKEIHLFLEKYMIVVMGLLILGAIYIMANIYSGKSTLVGGLYIGLVEHVYIPLLSMFFVFIICIKRSRLLRSKVLAFMGDVSYSTYLLHIVVIDFIARYITTPVLKFSLYVSLTYILAWLSFRYLEIPLKNKTKNFLLEKCFNLSSRRPSVEVGIPSAEMDAKMS